VIPELATKLFTNAVTPATSRVFGCAATSSLIALAAAQSPLDFLQGWHKEPTILGILSSASANWNMIPLKRSEHDTHRPSVSLLHQHSSLGFSVSNAHLLSLMPRHLCSSTPSHRSTPSAVEAPADRAALQLPSLRIDAGPPAGPAQGHIDRISHSSHRSRPGRLGLPIAIHTRAATTIVPARRTHRPAGVSSAADPVSRRNQALQAAKATHPRSAMR
jgi:hypothetical protein